MVSGGRGRGGARLAFFRRARRASVIPGAVAPPFTTIKSSAPYRGVRWIVCTLACALFEYVHARSRHASPILTDEGASFFECARTRTRTRARTRAPMRSTWIPHPSPDSEPGARLPGHRRRESAVSCCSGRRRRRRSNGRRQLPTGLPEQAEPHHGPRGRGPLEERTHAVPADGLQFTNRLEELVRTETQEIRPEVQTRGL